MCVCVCVCECACVCVRVLIVAFLCSVRACALMCYMRGVIYISAHMPLRTQPPGFARQLEAMQRTGARHHGGADDAAVLDDHVVRACVHVRVVGCWSGEWPRAWPRLRLVLLLRCTALPLLLVLRAAAPAHGVPA